MGQRGSEVHVLKRPETCSAVFGEKAGSKNQPFPFDARVLEFDARVLEQSPPAQKTMKPRMSDPQ